MSLLDFDKAINSAHVCHAIGCKIRVPRQMFMCRTHWHALPRHYRNAIWYLYHPNQCDLVNPSEQYCLIAKRCVMYIAQSEGREVTGQEPELKLYDWLRPKGKT